MSEGSRKTGISWAKRGMLKLWNIIYQICTSRNAFLHETGAIDRVCGLAQLLQQAITAEHAQGPGYLHQVYNRYFRNPLPSLLASSVASQKEWFAREATDLFAYDAFAISPSLCYLSTFKY